MSTLLKDIYSPRFYDKFSDVVKEIVPTFNKQKFIESIFADTWAAKELKDRMRHTSLMLHRFFPGDFEESAQIIEKTITKIRQNPITASSFEFMFFPDYIEIFGLEHYDISMKSIEFVTQFTSCEFAVRPFIIKYEDKMLQQMFEWSKHENHHVRRLASEGSRPRLPWAMALPALKKEPKPILRILENLKNDPSEYVRRSVANSLNDISKDNPHITLEMAHAWKNMGKETDELIKHGCRTLLKQGHADILKYYKLDETKDIILSDFQILTPSVKIGENLIFSFTIQNIGINLQTVRLEYGVFYVRQNGQLSKKVFKISERQFQPTEKKDILRKQSFRIITTRQFYAGQHRLSIIVNGREIETTNFELTE
jgi:3-methyladenine DNA glycosylase AlkC